MYITTKISSLYPLVATRPNGLKFNHTHKVENREIERVASISPVPEPLYVTEAAVTVAISEGTFKGFANTAYAEAKRYQAYLKSLEKPKFFRRKGSKPSEHGLNFRPGYAF